LGAAGIIAIAVGTALFVSSFKTDPVTQNQKVDGTEAGLGGGLVLAGFGLGIAGLALNPGQAERSRAEAARYAFLPPKDTRESVVTWTQSYNQAVRDRCERTPSP
jgi:pantothenate kinase type III